ncbi:FAD-dependent monooxygenase [Streptomyces sp. YIM 98790]|uniref:FAD-dependent monooxygenase n=1 Tax=Streptomyces sp. YIM 98790 TaxID=2689077 RepID=UPI00140B9BA7|nr:FAD-dependent monooxygenase [Streptomyces sp. YIM 98790]
MSRSTPPGGLAGELIATGNRISRARVFSGLVIDMRELPSRFPFVLITPQYETERVLQRRAERAGAGFRHETEFLDLSQDDDGVALRVRTPGGESTVHARYAVGTDGHHSTVRHSLDMPFPGESAVTSMVLADVRLAGPPRRQSFTANGTAEAFAILAPFGDGHHRVIGWSREYDAPEDVPLELDEVRRLSRQVFGTDFGMHDCRWLSRFRSDERQVPAYRDGRVFLAGDAAHVHSPAGGQGMNVGLQDAANLSWKLAAALDGRPGAAALLDSYHTERHPVGTAALRSSGVLIRAAMVRNRPQFLARTVLSRLALGVPALRRRVTGRVSGIDVAYPAPPGAHPLVGRRAPDLALAGGSRLYEALRPGRYVLVTPAGEELPGDGGASDHGGWVGRVHWASPRRRTLLLVRPDGHIAWASDARDPAERARGLGTALSAV